MRVVGILRAGRCLTKSVGRFEARKMLEEVVVLSEEKLSRLEGKTLVCP